MDSEETKVEGEEGMEAPMMDAGTEGETPEAEMPTEEPAA